MAHINSDILRLGVDVGSTTVKAVALDPADNSVLFTRYQRHNAHQADTVRQLLEEAAGHFPGMRFRIGVCGSGGRPIAAALGGLLCPGGGGQRGGSPGLVSGGPHRGGTGRTGCQGDLLPL